MPDTLARLARLALVSDERTILQAALRATARGVHAPLAEVLERSPDGETLVVRASRGWGRADGSRRDLPAGARSQSGFTLDVDEPVLLEDAAAEDRFEVAEAARGRDVGSGVTCVIAGVGAPFGVLAVHSPRVRAFGRDDVDRTHRIADIVALGVARVRSEHRVTELAEVRGRLVMETVAAEERERKRLAEALHDGAMQNVVTAGFDLDVLMAGDDDGDGERVRRARKAIADALRQLRSTVQDLHPIVGLQDGQLALTVADDGRGMRPGSRAAALRAGHIGLASSAERVELAGGRLDIDSAPGKGTTVTARLPA